MFGDRFDDLSSSMILMVFIFLWHT